jgi:tetratricopeptide (TPR) repeat protein
MTAPVVLKLGILLAAVFVALTSCSRDAGLPEPDSQEYRDLVAAFYVGLSGLQSGEDVRAEQRLTEVTRLAPGEPAGWANLGLLAVRHQEFDTAYENVERARSLVPDNSRIEALLGLIESRRGRLPEAIAHLRRAVELDPQNLRALYALAEETERQNSEASDTEAQQLLGRILEAQPENLAVLLDVARLAAKRGDGETLKTAASRLAAQSTAWPAGAKEQLTALEQAAASANPRSAALQTAFLRNVLAPVPGFRQSLLAVKTPVEFVAEPFLRFINLPSPSAESAPPDLAMTFSVENVAGVDAGEPLNPMVIAFDGNSEPSLVFRRRSEVQIEGGTRISSASPSSQVVGVAAFDFDYDFKTDLAVISDEGLSLHRQETTSSFTNVTAGAALPARILRARYQAVWTLDVDLDGDLDLLLSPAGATASPVVLRNNGDGTFEEVRPFDQLRDVRHFASADADGDGDPDLAVVSAGGFTVLANERLAQYSARPIRQDVGVVLAIAVGDLNRDSTMDFVLLNGDGQILRLSDNGTGNDWEVVEIARVAIAPDGADAQLLLADLDNNGSLDIVAGARNVLLGDTQGFTPVNLPSDVRVRAIDDVNNDGRLDLIGIQGSQGEARAVRLLNRGSRNYHYQIIRTRAAQATGDQRINSFGIGGEIEIRSGLLTQKQSITSSILHFGLGENTQTDVARIIWPNGSVQAEFELSADDTILAEQRLKGSCPMLFAWDGNQISYVKDTAPWSPALGLHINAQTTAGIYQTEEWFKIRGDQLAARDGIYDLRVTAELWEVYYIDHYSLLAVDHPEGTEVYADERFAVPPPPLRLYTTSTPKPFVRALDDLGEDVSGVVGALDQKYLGTFGKGRYQGITRDHWVELELPAEAPRDRPLYLIGHGFLHPTDGSINIAYSQTSYEPPEDLSIETPDAMGHWSSAKSGLGFPAGKLKSITLELTGLFRPGAPRRLRLRTNMEIYWDKLEWAEGLPDTTLKTQRVGLKSAELLWRGFSAFTQEDDTSPELPDYNRLMATTPKWRDLIGFYTRHGDVRELLEKVDGRMVIVNAGDEIRLKFEALPPPAPGMTRDYVMVGDGWIKDGDLNSTFSKTVAPLPYRGLKDYDTAPGRLEDEPAFKRNPQDWQTYHTRYVTPEFFREALALSGRDRD